MAARDHRVSRRALLGAAVAVALPVSIRPAQAEGAAPWSRALFRFREAEAAMRAAEGQPDEDEFDRRLDRCYSALRCLLRLPAPDLRALAAKIELVVDHEVGTLTGGERCLAVLKADARRLVLPPL